VAEIAATSNEQASGIEQVNKAVVSMDELTQQNAALVEQATAAAQSLNEQAIGLSQLMARFRLGSEPVTAAPARAPAAERRAPTRAWSKPGVKPRPSVTQPAQSKIAAGGTAAGWKQF
jgi:hypothetical protein